MILRPYQERDVERLRAALRRHRSVVYQAPTGSGKTAVFGFICQAVAERGKTAWVLVHRQELVAQTSRTLEMLGLPRGELHDLVVSGSAPSNAPIQVCSVMTLVRRIEQGRAGNPDLIIIDEAHHATAGSWRRILDARQRALVLGVTATPSRTDGHGLGVEAGGVFGDLVIGPSVRDLISQGYLCRPVVYAPPPQFSLDGVPVRAGDYAQEALAERLDKPTITGDAVAHYSRLCAGEPAIAFCVSVAHAQHVAEQFRGAGYLAESVDGTMRDDRRRRLIEDLGERRLNVLTSCELVSEGLDVPGVSAAICLRPTQSLALCLQQWGRAMRPAAGKTRALILDHVGNWTRHGLPDEDRPWSLGARPRRGRAGAAPEAAVRVQQCPECFAAHAPAAWCPECGHVYAPQVTPPRQVEGALVELSPEQVEAQRQARRFEVGRARTLEALQEIARARGYDPRWARMIWRSRQMKARRA